METLRLFERQKMNPMILDMRDYRRPKKSGNGVTGPEPLKKRKQTALELARILISTEHGKENKKFDIHESLSKQEPMPYEQILRHLEEDGLYITRQEYEGLVNDQKTT